MILTFCNINGISRKAICTTFPRYDGFGFIFKRIEIDKCARLLNSNRLITGITYIFYQVAAISSGRGQLIATVIPFVGGMALYPYKFDIVLFM